MARNEAEDTDSERHACEDTDLEAYNEQNQDAGTER